MLIPNTDRVLIKRIDISADKIKQNFILPGELKAGENLFLGEIVHPGDTKFKKGQKVYYSEYSTAAIQDIGAIERGEKKYLSKEDALFVVAQDDIMAYEEEETNAKA